MARPTKYGPEIHRAIVQSLEAGMSRTTSAESNGIDRGTLAQWIDRKPAFSRDVQLAIGKAKARATVTITKAIQAGDAAVAFRYLSLMEPHEWRLTVQVDHSGEINIRHIAAEVAAEFGVPEEEAVAEAERILAARRR